MYQQMKFKGKYILMAVYSVTLYKITKYLLKNHFSLSLKLWKSNLIKDRHLITKTYAATFFKLFYFWPVFPFFYTPLKTTKWFSDSFRRYKMGGLARNGLKRAGIF